MFRIILVCCFFVLVFFAFSQKIFAHEDLSMPEVSDPQVNEALERTSALRFAPGSRLSKLIVVKESFTHFFKPSSAKKAEYDLRISGKRLKEAYILTNDAKINKATRSLNSYSKIVKRMTDELARARSQNQDITTLIGITADVLKYHEILLAKIYFISEEDNNHYIALVDAIESFKKAVTSIDLIQPGLADRFESAGKQYEIIEVPISESPSPAATFGASPKIIIR